MRNVYARRDIRALTVGARFAQCCQQESSARVLSVHRRVINLLSGTELLALVLPQAGSSSRFLRLSALPKLACGDTVVLTPQALTTQDAHIDLCRVPLWENLLPDTTSAQLVQEKYASFERAYTMLDITPGANPHCALTPETVIKWIGLGPGLTPAGDDTVLGYLAIDNHLGNDPKNTQALHAAVSACLSRTTVLSAQLLKAALEKDYHESVQRVVAILCGLSTEDLCTAMRRLAAIGATSGASTLFGMRLALQDIAAVQFETARPQEVFAQ